jgi:threonine synthase
LDQWKRCLYCGAENNTANYTCSCIADEPAHTYRALGLRFQLNQQEITEVKAAFQNYCFNDERGMLQYPLLPNREYAEGINLKVGLTPLHLLKSFSKKSGIQVFIKDEGQNPSGCFKDRETLACLLNTRRRKRRKAVIYSSGNAAASAALFARQQGLPLITFVPGDTYGEKVAYIQKCGSDVVVLGKASTSFEEGFRLFVGMNEANVFEEAGFDNWAVRNPYRIQGDKTTAVEIARQLEEQVHDPIPDVVIVPSANGSNLAGIWEGFKELKHLGITDKLPRMVVAGITNANPICKAVRMQEQEVPVACDLSDLQEQDAKIGSIIVAEEGYDSVEAAKAVLESGGTAVEVGTHSIRKVMVRFLHRERRLALQHGVLPEPASYIAMAAVEKLRDRRKLRLGETAVAVITGHGIKAQGTTRLLLRGYPELLRTAHQIIGSKRRESPVLGSKGKIGQRRVVPADFDRLRMAFLDLAGCEVPA